MRKANNSVSYQAPLMSAFREAFEARDARELNVVVVDGERVIEGRQSRQRRGDENALKRDLSIDLTALLNTIDLGSVIDLKQLSYVRKSVLNYGMNDVTHLTSQEVGVDAIRDQLAAVLKTHEPRINPDTLHIDKEIVADDVNQRVRFAVSGEMFFSPLDVAVEFVAELEINSGKMNITRLPASS